MPSSVIRRFRYIDGDLEIEFVTGRRYRYFDVPDTAYQEMQRSSSKGKFFNARIRNRFQFEQIVSAV